MAEPGHRAWVGWLKKGIDEPSFNIDQPVGWLDAGDLRRLIGFCSWFPIKTEGLLPDVLPLP